MKLKFFFTIWLALIASAISVSLVHIFIFREHFWQQIDHQIETTASLLISSDLSKAQLEEFEEAEDIILEVLNGERINQFVIIYSMNGKILYRSRNTRFLPDELRRDVLWQTVIDDEGHYARILTLPISKPKKRIIQVGILLDEELTKFRELTQYLILTSSIIFVVISTVAWLLARRLLRPMKHLSEYLSFLSTQFKADSFQTQAFEFHHKLFKKRRFLGWGYSDEFDLLSQEVLKLQEKMRQSLGLTQAWTAQMAHELKTPLTILRNILEKMNDQSESKPVRDAIAEVDHLNQVISMFLEWATVENLPAKAFEVHAIKLSPLLDAISSKLDASHQRLEIDVRSDYTVFANAELVSQAITNLITNALKYSEKKVIARLNDSILSIIDQGPGIPSEILDKIGQPFNSGQKRVQSTGLGLAWVNTICKKYGWRLSFDRLKAETVAIIDFKPQA